MHGSAHAKRLPEGLVQGSLSVTILSVEPAGERHGSAVAGTEEVSLRPTESGQIGAALGGVEPSRAGRLLLRLHPRRHGPRRSVGEHQDRKSTRLNSSHLCISYAVFCFKKIGLVYRVHSGPGPGTTLSSVRLAALPA